MEQETKKDTMRAFILEVCNPDGDVILRRPSTSRHSLLKIHHALLHAIPDSAPFHVNWVTVEDMPVELFKSAKEKFDADFMSEMIAMGAEAELKVAADAQVLANHEAELTYDPLHDMGLEPDEDEGDE